MRDLMSRDCIRPMFTYEQKRTPNIKQHVAVDQLSGGSLFSNSRQLNKWKHLSDFVNRYALRLHVFLWYFDSKENRHYYDEIFNLTWYCFLMEFAFHLKLNDRFVTLKTLLIFPAHNSSATLPTELICFLRHIAGVGSKVFMDIPCKWVNINSIIVCQRIKLNVAKMLMREKLPKKNYVTLLS